VRRLSFYDHHRQSYHSAVWLPRPAVVGEFMIGEYAIKGGGVRNGGEFQITLYRFHNDFLSPQFSIFDDGLLSFYTLQKMGVVEKIRKADLRHRDDLARLLIKNDVRDRSHTKLADS